MLVAVEVNVAVVEPDVSFVFGLVADGAMVVWNLDLYRKKYLFNFIYFFLILYIFLIL
jgi:hypothetical protein